LTQDVTAAALQALRLPPRQADLLRAIARYWAEHGYAPGLRELGNALGVSSTTAVSQGRDRLVVRGLVRVDAHVPRSLVITELGHAWLAAHPTPKEETAP